MKRKQFWESVKSNKLLQLLKSRYLLALLLFIVWAGLLDSQSALRCSRVKFNIDKQEAEIEFYEREIEAIEQKLNQLNSNKDSLERFAREHYLFKEDDEEIFVVQPRE